MADIEGDTAPAGGGKTGGAAGARLVLGSAVALGSSITFALNVVLASIVYDAGGNIHALNLTRALLFMACLAAWLRAKGRPMALPRRPLVASLLLGLLLCLNMYTLLGAIMLIPVTLAILVLYIYPFLIAAATWVSGRESPSIPRLLALGVAFSGLVLALAAPVAAPDWRGVALAGGAAVGLATMLLTSERVMAGRDSRVVMFYMTVGTSGVVALLSATAVDLVWPAGTRGWLALAGSSGFYVVATFLLFTAVRMIGPLRTAVIDNTSPLWAMVFAMWLVGETLVAGQILGVALVVAALVFLQIVQAPHRPVRG